MPQWQARWMPQVGEDDVFESVYMAKLKAALAPVGLLIEYEKDRAALDLGLHLYNRSSGGTARAGDARVWLQAKGKKRQTLPAEQYASAVDVAVRGIPVETVRYWYGAPEPVYLVVYLESVDVFLAADVRELVDAAGGPAGLLTSPGQGTTTLRVPVEATLERAFERMPRHRSMRIDGRAWRGRPLGHGYDPLRSELQPLPETDFVGLVDALLAAHDFRREQKRPLADPGDGQPGPVAYFGRLGLTYEWVLPMTTEFGYDEGSDFRIEGAPLHAQGDVLVVVDPNGRRPDGTLRQRLRPFVEEAGARNVEQMLVFLNAPEGDAGMIGNWRVSAAPLACWPQAMGSLTFNVLVTTNVYLQFLDRLTWRYVHSL